MTLEPQPYIDDQQTVPYMSKARKELMQSVEIRDQQNQPKAIYIPAERALTIYLNKKEVITLMTLGASPELLVLGYLKNQRLLYSLADIHAITVDWDAGEHGEGIAAVNALLTKDSAYESPRAITSGCGQGSMFTAFWQDLSDYILPKTSIRQSTIFAIIAVIREQQSIYKRAGSVHGCALFANNELMCFIEDVGRHNALDTISGWMWLHSKELVQRDQPLVIYTTGRLTSEMILKAAQMQIAIIISRSGITQMAYQIANQLNMCVIGRALHNHYLCYVSNERIIEHTQYISN